MYDVRNPSGAGIRSLGFYASKTRFAYVKEVWPEAFHCERTVPYSTNLGRMNQRNHGAQWMPMHISVHSPIRVIVLENIGLVSIGNLGSLFTSNEMDSNHYLYHATFSIFKWQYLENTNCYLIDKNSQKLEEWPTWKINILETTCQPTRDVTK